ncbi:FHA domain-containing protein [Candidatus Saccharibacteria bacterium]|nr:FHA domain-containing protein [Candidatus Saccharibacteria bacterium]
MDPIKKPESPTFSAETGNETSKKFEARFEKTHLEPGQAVVIDSPRQFDDIPPMSASSYHGENDSVYQYPMAVIKAGGDYFTIIDTEIKDNQARLPTHSRNETIYAIAVTHHRSGQVAELIGYLGDGQETLFFGRDPQRDKYGPSTSRNHFALTYRPEGGIILSDLKSSLGTTVYTDSFEKRATVSDSAINPLGDQGFWAQDTNHILHAFGRSDTHTDAS